MIVSKILTILFFLRKVIIVASSNSMEVGVLGYTDNVWKQWMMLDSERAELPLGPDRQETWPVSLALDTATTRAWVESDETTVPAPPLLYLLSHTGVLCSFRVVNLRENSSQISQQPEKVADTSGMALFCKKMEEVAEKVDAKGSVGGIPEQQLQVKRKFMFLGVNLG